MYRISVISLILTFYSLELIDCTRVIADERFLEECLYAHNKYRALHENTPSLKLNRTATEYAVNRVMALAKMDSHRAPMDKRGVYGENFYWYYDTTGYHSCQDAVDVWYNGIAKYNYNKPSFSDSTGGFSQVVWRGSTSIGCALIEQDKSPSYPETFIVCNYFPAGNVETQYPYNVYPLKEKVRPPSGSGGSNNAGSNEWSADRPSGGSGNRPERPDSHRPERPDNHRPGIGNRPPVDERPPINSGGGQKPGAGSGSWNVDRPGGGSGQNSGIWTVPAHPSGGSSNNRPKPPIPPSYPLILLHPMF